MGELQRATGTVDGKILAPAPKRRTVGAERYTAGRTTSAHGGEYDWFDGLSKREQRAIRLHWMAARPKAGSTFATRRAVSPDEVERHGFTMTHWLALVRGVDAAKRIERGKARPGDLKYVHVGRPEDYGIRTRARKSTGDREYTDYYGSSRVQYFTDANGEVHPIRASYESPELRARHDYGADEPF